MKTEITINSVLIISLFVCVNSRELPTDSGYTSHRQEGLEVAESEAPRDGRKLFYINNVAYNLTDEEVDKLLSNKENGTLPKVPTILENALNESIETVITDHLQEEQEPIKSSRFETDREKSDEDVQNSKKLSITATPDERTVTKSPVKSSRFVADPEKAHLIEKVDEEEVQNLKKLATTAEPVDRVVTESPNNDATETATIRYEFTQVSVLQYLWNELRNIGDLLGREMIGTVSGTLSYLWETLVRYLDTRNSRGIQGGGSGEL